GKAARDAAIPEAEVVDGIEGTHAAGPADRRACPRLGRERRDAAVGRIDHHRGVTEVSRAFLVAEGSSPRVIDLSCRLALPGASGELLVAEIAGCAELWRGGRTPPPPR